VQTPVVVTTGDAVVRRTPDRAFVDIAVEARAKNPRDAQRQNADAMTAVRQRLTQARIANDAVKTLGYTLDQEFEMVQNNRVPAGFLARNTIVVRIDDITRVGEILDLVVRGGANSVAGIRFDLKDRAEAEREALRLAVADAGRRSHDARRGRLDRNPSDRHIDGGDSLGAGPSHSMGRAHGACEVRSRREEEAMRDIADDEQRRARPQSPCALRVPAARRHLRRRSFLRYSRYPRSSRLASAGAALGTRPML